MKTHERYPLKPESDIESWVDKEGGRFLEAYYYLRAVTNFRSEVCFVGAWMSLSTDDRGDLSNWTELADWLGSTRASVYRWRTRYVLDEWAEHLRLVQLRGQPLGEVDRVTFNQARDPDAPVDARRLFYQRVKAMSTEVTVRDKTQEEMLNEWLDDLRAAGADEDEDEEDLE